MPGSRFGKLWLPPLMPDGIWMVRWTSVAGEPATTTFFDRQSVAAFVAVKSQQQRVRVYRADVYEVFEVGVSAGDDGESWDTWSDAESVGSRDGSPVDGLPDPPADPAHEVRAERLPTPSFVTR